MQPKPYPKPSVEGLVTIGFHKQLVPDSHKGHLTPVLSFRHAERKYGLIKPPHSNSRVLSPTPLSYKERRKDKRERKKEKKKNHHHGVGGRRSSQGPIGIISHFVKKFTRKLPSNSPIIRNTETTSTKQRTKEPYIPNKRCTPRPIKESLPLIDHHKYLLSIAAAPHSSAKFMIHSITHTLLFLLLFSGGSNWTASPHSTIHILLFLLSRLQDL